MTGVLDWPSPVKTRVRKERVEADVPRFKEPPNTIDNVGRPRGTSSSARVSVNSLTVSGTAGNARGFDI